MIDWNKELPPGLRASYSRNKSWVMGLLMTAFIATQVLFLYRTFKLLSMHGWSGLARGSINSDVSVLVPIVGLVLTVVGVCLGLYTIHRIIGSRSRDEYILLLLPYLPINFASKVAFRVLSNQESSLAAPEPVEHYIRLAMANWSNRTLRLGCFKNQ